MLCLGPSEADSCVFWTLKKMSRYDGIDLVMSVIADRQGNAEAVLPDLTCVNAELGRDDVVE